MYALFATLRRHRLPGRAVLIGGFLLLVQACSKPDIEPVDALSVAVAGGQDALPTVLTVRVEGDLADDSIKVVGTLVRHGSSWVRARGICFGTGPDAVVENGDTIPFYVNESTAIGEFTVWLDTVFAGMYVRAYATNQEGTGYGQALPITGMYAVTGTVIGVEDVSARVSGIAGGTGLTQWGLRYADNLMDLDMTGAYQTADDIADGNFEVELTGLAAGTTYFARAFARDGIGTYVYGDTISFTTRSCPSTMQDVDGNTYPVVEIGGECWMAANLRTRKYRDDTFIAIVYTVLPGWPQNSDSIGERYPPDGEDANLDDYGYLYNRLAVDAVGHGGLCPVGWHVASTSEWGSVTSDPGELGLELAGKKDGNGFSDLGSKGWWWTATGSYQLFNGTLTSGSLPQFNTGYSVRCVKD